MSRKEIQRERNEQCSERHALAVDRLRSMVSEETAAEKYRPFFRDAAIFLLELENVRRKISDGVWESYSLEPVQRYPGRKLFEELCESCICGRKVRTGNGSAALLSLCGDAFGNPVFL